MSGSIVRCPHCEGFGSVEAGDRSVAGPTGYFTEAYAKSCMVCAEDPSWFHPRRAVDWSQGSPGRLVLPLTDAQVEVVEEQACACCAHLILTEAA